MTQISVYDISTLDGLIKSGGVDPQQLRSFRNDFFKKRFDLDAALRDSLIDTRQCLESRLAELPLVITRRENSDVDGATKLLLETSAGFRIEAVILRIASGRTTLCISSQVGCAAACAFCATGRMEVVRDLSTPEIVDQVRVANQLLRGEDRRVRNVVFMGMGEPFHNESAVYGALDVLLDPRCFEFSPSRVTVSTVGIPEAMVRCAKRYPKLRMALSLHSARQQVRERIVPLARRYDLKALRAALDQVASVQGQRIMIEYLLLDGLTDTDEDIVAVSSYLDGLDVHLNLIPYNAIDDADDLRPSSPDRARAFSAALKAKGLPVTLRYSLGADITAACGQLLRKENRKIARDLRR